MLANFTDDSSFVQKKKRIVTKNKLGKKNCGHVVGESRQIRSNQGSPTCGDWSWASADGTRQRATRVLLAVGRALSGPTSRLL
jgi:hypothetical protein